MRIWFKEWKDNHLIKDTVVEDFGEETRTHKVFMALEEACRALGVPIYPIEEDGFALLDAISGLLPEVKLPERGEDTPYYRYNT